ncbi:hypothetical protein C6503_09340 [Candidatus Poribacteria bacterium]|nr:MAG: hypothetical protein C6503_09340 [Candidatus Poribacteria bacterium]
MKSHLQTTLLALCISLLLSSFAVNADTSKTTNSAVEYYYYEFPNDSDGQKYHSFLPAPAPEGLFYDTRVQASANIDDTPEKESVVIVVAATSRDVFSSNWVQMFLLITEAETEEGLPKKKALFKLFDSGTHALEVPAAKAIELQNPLFVFWVPSKDSHKPQSVSFELVDLTGDGALDIWVEFGYAVTVISFQNGEFRKIFGRYGYHGNQAKAYVDLDNDGIYEIKMPYSVYPRGPKTERPTWINLYEWNGNMYILNNAKFYTRDNDILIQLMIHYNAWLRRERETSKWTPQRIELIKSEKFAFYAQTCQFYMGLAHYYGGDEATARAYLWRVTEQGRNEHYIQAAEAILKKLSPPPK